MFSDDLYYECSFREVYNLYLKTKKEKQTLKLLKENDRFTPLEVKKYIEPYIIILNRNQDGLVERLDELVELHDDTLSKIKGMSSMNMEGKYAALSKMYKKATDVNNPNK